MPMGIGYRTPAKARRAVRKQRQQMLGIRMGLGRRAFFPRARDLIVGRGPAIFDPLGARVSRRTLTPGGVVRAGRRFRV